MSLIYCGVDFGFGGIVIYGRFEVNRERERGREGERESGEIVWEKVKNYKYEIFWCGGGRWVISIY